MSNVIRYCDSHAHLTSSEIFKDVDAVLERAKATNIDTIINIATGEQSLVDGLALSQKYPWVFNAAAVHPHDAEQEGEGYFPIVSKHALKGDLVAVGETGLDYHYHHSKPEIQQLFLRKHLQLALQAHLPVIIHCREAFADFFRILDEEYKGPGVLHCFTGTMADAEQALKRGWYLSLSGVVTFKKSEELRQVAKMVPLDRLLIETDAPYLAPQSKRGKPNEPAYVVETAQTLAEVKGISVEELAKATSNNLINLFLKSSPKHP